MCIRGVVLLMVLLATWLPPTVSTAQPQARGARRGRAAAIDDLGSGEISRMLRGLQALGGSRSASAVAPLEAFVRRGAPAAVLVPAIDALGALGRLEAVPVLASLLRHHRADARARAAVALAPLRSARSSAALVVALGDPDPAVRDAAARALSTAGTSSALPVLHASLARGNLAAAMAIGALGDTRALEQIVALGDTVPRSALVTAARAMFARREGAMRMLLASVDVLAAAGGPEVTAFLTEVRSAPGRSRPFVQHVDAALIRARISR